jgi:hypothetical protein
MNGIYGIPLFQYSIIPHFYGKNGMLEYWKVGMKDWNDGMMQYDRQLWKIFLSL